MGNRFAIGAIIAAIILFVVYQSAYVVNAREQALTIRFGEIQDVRETPGLYFKVPFIDTVQFIEKRALRFDLEDIRVQVSGGKFYEVDAFVLYNITDPLKFRQTVSADLVAAESRLRTRLNSALRTVYGLRGFEAALSDERTSMMNEVRDQLRPEAENLGIQIDDVRIRRTDLTQEVSQQTFERMKAERLAEAELIRARGNEAGQRIRAIADRQVVEIESEARRDSEIIRGEGDAERNRIFAEAFGKDEGFFEFYRSMAAYAKSFADTGTTMVLSPDSEFFQFFGNAGQSALPANSGSSSSAANAGSGTQEPAVTEPAN
ncbi:protease modulator HflC [Pseudohoeflea suaedae]|uniref:Protein HflC n=1 Tax=Pseudohoeflea suaedae TaxID=877384 RepID=A0A4R5PH45_9HYPH|nr:protease modulator HflC [Pseudohoeflea suaedae]TDH34210.1 protease modulator HflC [Pseudohoeflea suaedae]